MREAVEQVLSAHEPYPAVVVDGHWNLLASNDAVGALLEGVSPPLLEAPANVLRISLHPDGMAPRIVNLGEWRGHLLQRLRRQIALSGDPALVALAKEAQEWPAGDEPGELRAQEIVAPLRLLTNRGELAFFSTITTFGTAVEITTSELSIESFYPADRASAAALASAASR